MNPERWSEEAHTLRQSDREAGWRPRTGPKSASPRSRGKSKCEVGADDRHRHTNQAFIPMGKTVLPGGEALEGGGGYLVVAALNGPDDKPDMSTARAFLGTVAQGISYNAGIWHHSLLTIDGPLDYLLVEAQIGDWSVLDCEKEIPSVPFATVQVPPFTAAPAVKPAAQSSGSSNVSSAFSKISQMMPSLPSPSGGAVVPVPITREGFAPFGQVIQPYPDPKTRWEGQDIQVSPDGITTKYARLAQITSTYPIEANAVMGISVFRATPKVGLTRGKMFDVRFMERHPYTSQAFVPMGKGEVSSGAWHNVARSTANGSGKARLKMRSRKEVKCSSSLPRMAQMTSPTQRLYRRSSCPRRLESATMQVFGVSGSKL